MSVLLESDLHLAESLAPAVSPDTTVVGDMVAVRRALADDQRHLLVVIGPDVELSAATELASSARVSRPALGVVLVRRRLDTSVLKEAMRAGVREVVKLDDLTGLTQACRASRALSEQMSHDVDGGPHQGRNRELGRLVTVFSSKGGCGKTTIATNLAAALAKAGKQVCLVDLDLAFGDVAIALQLLPQRTIADLGANSGGIDKKAAASVITSHSPGLDTVLAPVEPGAAENITAALVGELLQCLKTMYDVVVVDTPPAFTDQALAAFDASDHLALVTTLDIPALKNLKLTLETLELLGYARDRWNLVLNRADSKVGLAVEDVQKTLRTPIAAQIPSSRAVPAAINRGVAIVQDAPNHAVSLAVRDFARHLLAQADGGKSHAAPARRVLRLRRRVGQVPA